MKRWTRTMTGMLAAALLCTMQTAGLPVQALVAEEEDVSGKTETITIGSTFDDGTLTYTVIDDRKVAVTSCVNTATHISIMPEIDSYDVVEIEDSAFAGCDALQALSIPYTVTSIGEGAFQGCTSLTKITLPDSVTEVPDGAFMGCTALESVDLGNAVTSLGRMAFGYCSALTDITIPETVTTMGDQLFYYCTSLKSVTIPESVTALGAYTFQYCTALTEFTLPDYVTEMGYLSFMGCQNLKSVTVSDSHPTYTLQDGVLYSKDMTMLYWYPSGKTETNFVVPERVTTIYDGAFFGASALQSVTFSEQLETIGSGAFDYCTNLSTVNIPASVTWIGGNAFSDCTALRTVMFSGDAEATEPALEIGAYAFYCCERLMDVTLPKRVTEIGEFAFGVTEQSITNADGTVSDEVELLPVSGFLLTGYEGAAAKYVSACRSEDVRINFKSLEIPWLKIVGFSLLGTGVLVLIFLAARIIRKRKLSPAEKNALDAATEERKIPLSQREPEETKEPDDGYESILGVEEPSLPPLMHQFGHHHTDADNDNKE